MVSVNAGNVGNCGIDGAIFQPKAAGRHEREWNVNRLAKPRRTYLPAFREWIRGRYCLLHDMGILPANACDGFTDAYGHVVTECAHVKSRGSGGDDPNNLIPLCGKHHRWGK